MLITIGASSVIASGTNRPESSMSPAATSMPFTRVNTYPVPMSAPMNVMPRSGSGG